MASSEINSEEILKLNERLYSESYFRLLKSKNNASESADEMRNLIRQIDIHCSMQNLNKKGADVLKSQLISEYSYIVDSQEQEGLLPIVTDDINDKWFQSSSKSSNYTLMKGRQCCMDYINKGLGHKSTVEISEKHNLAPVSTLNSKTPSYGQSAPISHLNLRQKDLNQKNRSAFCNQSNVSNSHSSKSLNRNQTFHQKQSAQSHNENALKRRANDSTAQFSKRQNNRMNNDEQASKDTIKNSFIPASSMYKNPLKSSNAQEKQPESSDLDYSTSSDIKNHPTLKHFDQKIVGIIISEIMDFSPDIKWSDIAGLEFVKSTVQEIVIWPLLRPDIFTGLRAPPRGILLFGPPGTGKTLIGKCIATESNSTFFCISASSLASKWVGESEQLVRALFAVAQLHQPAVIFIDEIDSLLSQRSDQEQDHTRKLKTEFLVQFDGAKTTSERRVLVVGATNRPHELDEAARRRFVKRLYVPLPEESARLQIIEKLLVAHQNNLSSSDFKKICEETKGYSGSDVAHLCKEAAMGPIRSIGPEQIKTVSLDQVRPIELVDFLDALKQVRASVAQEDLNYYLDWNKKFGSFAI